MALATRSKIRRMFAGRFNEKGEFFPRHVSISRRHHCDCNANGFVAGQIINHRSFCPYSKSNIEAFLNEESTFVQLIVLVLVAALCSLACIEFIASIQSL